MLSFEELNNFGFFNPTLLRSLEGKIGQLGLQGKPDRSPSWTESYPPQQNKFASMISFQERKKNLCRKFPEVITE